MPPQNHYQILGIEPTAPLPSVQSALDRLANQANQLAYTSPDRSRELWERVRQIRGDLLSSPARRQAYDASLQQSRFSVATMERAVASSVSRTPSAPEAAIPPPVPTGPAPRVGGSRRHGVGVWPLLAAAAIVALTLGLAFALHHPASPHPHRVTHRVTQRVLPSPSALTTTGFRKAAGFVSGKRITMRWHPIRGAVLYHLQVAAISGAGSAFRHPLLSVLTEGTSHSVKLPGERRYMWRVQALVSGRWGPYARRAGFLVERPSTSAPQPRPSAASPTQDDQVRLCWSPVPWAVAYRLRIQPLPAAGDMTVHGTCQTVTENPGTYTWSVAGLVRGVQTYAGPFSAVQRFTVPASRTAAIVHPYRHVRAGTTQGIALASRSEVPSTSPYAFPIAVQATTVRTKRASHGSAPILSASPSTTQVTHTPRHARTSMPPPPPAAPLGVVGAAGASTPGSYLAAPSPTAARSTPLAGGYLTPVIVPSASISVVSTVTTISTPSPSVSYYVSPTAVVPPTNTVPPASNPSFRGQSASAPGQICPGKDEHPGCREGQYRGHGP